MESKTKVYQRFCIYVLGFKFFYLFFYKKYDIIIIEINVDYILLIWRCNSTAEWRADNALVEGAAPSIATTGRSEVGAIN